MSDNINSCHNCGASNATLRCSKVGVFGLASRAAQRFADGSAVSFPFSISYAPPFTSLNSTN